MESLPGNFFDFFIQFFGLVVFFVQAKAENIVQGCTDLRVTVC